MRLGIVINYAADFKQAAAEIVDQEKAGLDFVSVPEAYSFDAVSQLGYLAAITERLTLTSGILQLYSRTPTLTAMTAAGLDYVSGGRFELGLGASGPQVVEGFHGVPYTAPLGRTRETIEICRKVWRREVVVHEGKHYQIPLPEGMGTGLGKPLKLINHPVRERIPISIASIGPKNVELTAEVAEGWQPIFFHPEKWEDVWGEPLAAGKTRRAPELGALQTTVQVPLAIGEDAHEKLDWTRPHVALYIGGMGARGKNFYNELATRYGYDEEAKTIQDLYLDGRKEEAAAAVPAELIRAISLIGTASEVHDRIQAFEAAGVTGFMLQPLAATASERLTLIEQVREIADR